MQAKDIPDDYLIELVRRLSNGFPRVYRNMSYWDIPEGIETGTGAYYANTAFMSDILAIWSTVPPKVIRAKLDTLIKRGKLTGCTCGCRGDFEVIEN